MDTLKSQVPLWKKENNQWLEPGDHEIKNLEKWND
jgi:molybdopterin synthase catalytic subunit